MEIRLFGAIEVVPTDGRPTPISAAKVRQLLASLASEPGRVKSVDVIIDSLWGDAPPPSSGNLVQGYVSDLRRVVGAERVERRGSGYVLALDRDRVDLARFEDLLSAGRQALERGDAARASGLLDTCARLVRARLFADIPVHGPLRALQVRVGEAAIEMEELRGTAELLLGRHRQLVPRLEELVAMHPLHEAFWVQLASSLYRCGRQAEALRRCQQVRSILREEIGVSPGHELLDVEQRIIRQDPRLETAPSSIQQAAHEPEAPATIVGRRDELGRLTDRWLRAVRGEQHLVLVGGEPGIGKSTLASELARRAAAHGAVVLLGRCDEQINAPYLPFVAALGDHLRSLDDERRSSVIGGHGVRVAEVLPTLAVDRHDGAAPGPDAGPTLLERYETLTWLLGRVRGSSPLVLVLEDLQWADSTTIGLLSYLMSGSRVPGSLILATYRSTEMHSDGRLADLLASLRSDPQAERLTLAGLSVDEVQEYIDHDRIVTGDGLAAWIHLETGGNPLFVRELVRHVHETGDRTRVPEGVTEVVGRRVRRLTPPARTVLSRAAVLGNEFSVALLRAMNRDVDDLGAVVAEVEDAGILCRVAGSVEPTYGFTHASVRRAVAEQTSIVAREELHLRAADALSALDPSAESAMAVAAHVAAAGSAAPPERAVEAFIDAATYADSKWAKAEAVQWYDMALRRLPPDDERRRSLRLTRFVAAQAAWHWHHDQRSIRAGASS